MDVKSLAKSKRAHTQHHSKRPHHSHKLKAPPPPSPPSPSNASNDAVGAPAKKQPNEKTTTRRSSRSRGPSALPDNWDRYEEEEELDSVSPEGASRAPGDDDVVLPKSKGADFRHLVAEAQSHAGASLEVLPSLDDILPGEFNVGLGSMLAARGEGILSWVGDDNFVVEEKTGGNEEASFISLNLHALAENLAKVELSKRLFIEPDLLPTELCVEGLTAGSNEEHDKLKTTEDNELANRMSKELNLDDFAADQFTLSSPCSSSHAASASSDDLLFPVNRVNVTFQQVSDKNKAFFPSEEANLHTTEGTRRKRSTFEAAGAEKELDMILDSLSETKILDSQDYKSSTNFPVSFGVSSVDPPQISTKEPVSSKTVSISASLDDALDDLLEETSTLTNPNVLVRPQEERSVPHSAQSSSHSGSNSKVSDDFDSWFDTL